MRLADYQAQAMRTAGHLDRGPMQLASFALGVAGEAGEVADLVKKHLGHGHDLDIDKITKELGDVLWYVAALSGLLGIPLVTVARVNIEKLRQRYPEGFDPERSKHRPNPAEIEASVTEGVRRG